MSRWVVQSYPLTPGRQTFKLPHGAEALTFWERDLKLYMSVRNNLSALASQDREFLVCSTEEPQEVDGLPEYVGSLLHLEGRIGERMYHLFELRRA